MSTSLDPDTLKARAAFLEAIGSMSPLEITWAMGILEDAARDRIKECESESMRHLHFGRTDKARSSIERIPFYEKLIALRGLWRDFEMCYSAPGIIEAITGKKTPRPKKKI